ncbi:hypothetical protein B9T31_06010 [Acinetobacter sp. ANC 4558]|uniref:nuclear transport factor 2 family protein n=1 Tax=Acinetobacter sp. ANC 4558 TaxID=1977876 RepID=UPI000A34CC89|nr:nuclear transport factor 2 family protein [Acinetobacter sp. ANC 4558]OTG87160.1 hypothetical protein B9T31_06010 [Acinetobacter sp. ANC 4558]
MHKNQQSLNKWHLMLAQRDMSLLQELLADDVVFRSPVAITPYVGKSVVTFILTNVIQVFENFRYHREFYTEDRQHIVLEFSANIHEKELKGIDMIQFNEDGKIQEIEVMIRPKNGLEALALQMGERIKQYSGS